MDLLDELSRLVAGLRKAEVDFALCGGLAMAVYAFPRATLGIDLMMLPELLDEAKTVAGRLGSSKDAGLMNFREGRIQIHRLAKPMPDPADPLTLDFLLVTPETRSIWESRRIVMWENGELPVVSPEGLIALKSMRDSGQDQDDIRSLRSLLDEA